MYTNIFQLLNRISSPYILWAEASSKIYNVCNNSGKRLKERTRMMQKDITKDIQVFILDSEEDINMKIECLDYDRINLLLSINTMEEDEKIFVKDVFKIIESIQNVYYLNMYGNIDKEKESEIVIYTICFIILFMRDKFSKDRLIDNIKYAIKYYCNDIRFNDDCQLYSKIYDIVDDFESTEYTIENLIEEKTIMYLLNNK